MDENLTNEEVEEKFQELVQPKKIQKVVKKKRQPSKFPELRYLWGLFGITSASLIVLTALIQVILESM
jgi:hypothetical protein